MKKIIMIVAVVLLVAGAAFGGMMIGRKQAPKAPAATEKGKAVSDEVKADAGGGEGAAEGEKEAKPAEKSEGGEKKEGEGAATAAKEAAPVDLIYVFDKFTTNLSDDLATYVQMKVELEAASADAKKTIEANVAPLRDATLMLLSSKTRDDVQSLAGKERLKRELLVRYQGVLNSSKIVRNVYITEFAVVRY